jgi:L-fuculose-phosphate aldolase
MLLEKERALIVEYGRLLLSRRLVTGTGGNLSVCDRSSGCVAISPSGIEYEHTQPNDVVVVAMDGAPVEGERRPSSELAMHLALYGRRSDVCAIVHTHSTFATTLACLACSLPAVHYLIGFAGKEVRCAPYATFGTHALADSASRTIGDANAVLLAHHGLLACGADLPAAFNVAEQVEYCAEIYWRARTVGAPAVIPDGEMDRVIEKFADYGRR